jgi:hypothetical protein
MSALLNQVSVTTQSFDLIYVDILNQKLQYESFEYIIYTEDKKMIRRGQFRAPSVQIRTCGLQEGTYEFQLLLHGEEWKNTLFQKQSQED